MDTIRLHRDHFGPHMNVPHIVRHSPTGINWGYAGAGPSDAALSILTYWFGGEIADLYVELFSDTFLVSMPHEGGLVEQADVIEWIATLLNEAHPEVITRIQEAMPQLTLTCRPLADRIKSVLNGRLRAVNC